MNIDDLFDKIDENPIKSLLTFWVVAGIVSLIGLVSAIVVIVAVLYGLGVL